MLTPEGGLEMRGSGTTVMDWLVAGPLLLEMADGGRKPGDPLADQGVVLWGCRKAGAARVVADGGTVRGDDELAAWATRSQTCLDDR